MVRSLALLAFLAICSPASGAVLTGIVLDGERNTPVPVAIITAAETQRYVTTATGRFRFEDLPVGKITLLVEHVGYERWSHEIDLPGYDETHIIARLKPRIQLLEPVEVTSPRPDTSVPQGKRTILPMQIRRSAGAVATDPLRVVQAQPGVAAAGDDFTNRYVVRGGDPEENIVLVDDFPLLQPNHLEGFTSVVYDDLIGRVEVLPGALPPRFGDAVSSITSLDFHRPEETTKFFRYDLGSIALGGQGKGRRISGLGALRTNFYNLIIRRPPGIDKRSFQDLSAKFTYTTDPLEGSLLAVASRDREEGDFDREVDAILLGIRLGAPRGNLMWHADLSFADRDRRTQIHRPASKAESHLQRVRASAGLFWMTGPDLQTRVDAELKTERFDDGARTSRAPGGALAAEAAWKAGLFRSAVGGRLEKIPFTTGTPVSPYVSVRLRGLGRLVPGAGWRIARQSPFHLHESPEVAGLPVDPAALLEAGRDEVVPIQAHHRSVSCEADLGRGFNFVVEGYEKRYRRLLTWGEDGPTAATIRDNGTGRGRGVEVSLRREVDSGPSGWLSYAISRTRKREGASATMRPADYDRPKMLQAALDLPLSEATSLTFALRASSGRPITPLIGSGEGGLTPGEVNSERLPSYRRLDVKLEHRIEGRKQDAFLYLDVLNVLNRMNTVDVIQYVGAGGEVVRIYSQGVRILPVAGFGLYF
jgi:hypothetical protein